VSADNDYVIILKCIRLLIWIKFIDLTTHHG
jgi:hypothetical protein